MPDIHIIDNGSKATAAPVAFTTGNLNIDFKRGRLSGPLFAMQVNYDGALTVSAVNLFFSNDGVTWFDHTGVTAAALNVLVTPAGGSERSTSVTFNCLGFERFRVQFVHSAGTPNVSAILDAA